MLNQILHSIGLIIKDYPDDGAISKAWLEYSQQVQVIFISTYTLSSSAKELLYGALTKGLKLKDKNFLIIEANNQILFQENIENIKKYSFFKFPLIVVFGQAYTIEDKDGFMKTFSADEIAIDRQKKKLFWQELQKEFASHCIG